MSAGWHYAEGGKTTGPLGIEEMQSVLSKMSDPRNLWVWKVGFKSWARAGDVQELAEFIDQPPPLPQMARRKAWNSQEVWRSAAAIGVSLAVVWVASDYLISAPLAALPLVVGLDWATRRRRQFAARVR
jgi:hypothetical protein